MSAQICQTMALLMRSTCCHAIKNRSCLHKAVLLHVASSGVCVPWAPACHKRAYSLDPIFSGPGCPTLGTSSQQACAEKTPPSSSVTHRNLSAVAVQDQRCPTSRYDFLDLGETETNTKRIQARKNRKYLIADPDLAALVTEYLRPKDDKTIFFECNPGPGVLTRTLLNTGAQRVVALEGDKFFLRDLQELEGRLDGQLDVVHCDFFKMDPFGVGSVNPPAMFTDILFTHLGISKTAWTDDIPVKIFGIMPQNKERGLLLKMIYALFEQLSFYTYGRVELNLFISEKEYVKLLSQPGDMQNYRACSVLWQMACEIELLHKEPRGSFLMSSSKAKKCDKDNLCLVRLRPRADLFSAGLTPFNAPALLMMVKQCLVKRKIKLIDRLNPWSPDSGSKLLSEMGMQEDVLTGHVFPEEYLRLFQLMDKSQDFNQSWLYKEMLENTERNGWC
ncbi:dimethyladenosine transferase 2, mitochondrial [Brachionichthys hirsutus]|uniref:dimethyladenosine transferase 2, mitochondrial n=1 Tax=Brachionichthys hirsutus TaxID=412623 RepID=UPI0036054075